jgi:ADP-ribosylglycohydrolase
MIGAIIGDIIGSPYEVNNINTTDFPLFGERSFYTDDTILTIAVCDAILKGISYRESLYWWGNRYPSPYGEYGGYFLRWLNEDDPQPYDSWGNGAAMRVSAVGWLFDSLDEVLLQAKLSAEVSHNHPEGIKGAQAIASAVLMARTECSKDVIKKWITTHFGYDLDISVEYLQKNYVDGNFKHESCQDSVPQAIVCFLESDDFESAIRLAVSIGGDTDTIACMTGGIAEAFYGFIERKTIKTAMGKLPLEMRFVIDDFICRTNSLHLACRVSKLDKLKDWFRRYK